MSEDKNKEILNTEQVEDVSTAETPSSDEDIFQDIFGVDSDKFVARAGESSENIQANEASEVSESSNPKENPDQFQYWQSQTDKAKAENEMLQGRLSALESKVSGNPGNVPPANPVLKEMEKPIRPSKPSGFDNSEAITDPNSVSAKYVDAREKYLDNMSEYLLHQDNVRTEVVEKQQADQQRVASEVKLVSDLQQDYGYSPSEAKDFMQTMSAPESLSLNNLVLLHKALSVDGSEKVNTPPPTSHVRMPDIKAQTMNARQQKLSIPKPISTQPNASTQSSKKTEDKMMDSMIGEFNKKNPF